MALDLNGGTRQSVVVPPPFYEPHPAVWFYPAEATFYLDDVASPAGPALVILEALPPGVFRSLALPPAAALNYHALKVAVLRFYGATHVFPSHPYLDVMPSEPPSPEQDPCSPPQFFCGTDPIPTPPYYDVRASTTTAHADIVLPRLREGHYISCLAEVEARFLVNNVSSQGQRCALLKRTLTSDGLDRLCSATPGDRPYDHLREAVLRDCDLPPPKAPVDPLAASASKTHKAELSSIASSGPAATNTESVGGPEVTIDLTPPAARTSWRTLPAKILYPLQALVPQCRSLSRPLLRLHMSQLVRGS
ncbi:hypothetical protein V5799_025070 [Amblyomma americanum]|uniref:Uncharacterized protein n=1 Tax=Amblyomma americanum TaxID=6943 RepID=A0AAQ4EAC8_AMBAM